jgi:hypothetical protein
MRRRSSNIFFMKAGESPYSVSPSPLHSDSRMRLDIGYGTRGELIVIHRSTISRLFKRRKWSRKQLKRISLNRSEVLRRGYLDIVFLDEKDKTGWRYHAYAPTSTTPEIHTEIDRGKTWSICAAMTLDGNLPCTGLVTTMPMIFWYGLKKSFC